MFGEEVGDGPRIAQTICAMAEATKTAGSRAVQSVAFPIWRMPAARQARDASRRRSPVHEPACATRAARVTHRRTGRRHAFGPYLPACRTEITSVVMERSQCEIVRLVLLEAFPNASKASHDLPQSKRFRSALIFSVPAGHQSYGRAARWHQTDMRVLLSGKLSARNCRPPAGRHAKM